MKKHISNIINQSYIEAVNNNPVFDEEDNFYKFKNKNVMIVNTKDKDHFDIYKKHKFYHIPKKSLSKINLGVKYLAFYQPKDKLNTINKFDNNYGIEYYAKIKNFYEYKRGNCSEINCESKKVNDIYIRIELEEFKKVGPIERIEYGSRTVNYTTLYLLKNSNSMHELYFNNKREIEVYKMIDCQYKCNTLYLCCIKYLCRCFISETLAGSIIYYSNNMVKLLLTYRRKIKLFGIKLS